MNAIDELRFLLLESAEIGVLPAMLAVDTELLVRVIGEYGCLKSELRDERLTGFGCHVGRRVPAHPQGSRSVVRHWGQSTPTTEQL